jgi:hypothetical protein
MSDDGPVVTLYEAAKRLSAHRDTLGALCVLHAIPVHRDDWGIRLIATCDLARLEAAYAAWRDRPRLYPRRPERAPLHPAG